MPCGHWSQYIGYSLILYYFITRRRSTARRQTKSRRSTQPVSTELLQKIKQGDIMEEKQFEESLGGTVSNEIPKVILRNEQNEESKNDITALQQTAETKDEVKDPAKGPEQDTKGPDSEENGSEQCLEDETKGLVEKDGICRSVQSAYKPSNRPASKLIADDDIETFQVVISEELSSNPPQLSLSLEQQEMLLGGEYRL